MEDMLYTKKIILLGNEEKLIKRLCKMTGKEIQQAHILEPGEKIIYTVDFQYRTIIKTFDITPKERNKALEAFKKCVKNAENSRSVMFGSYCYIEAFDPEEYQSHVEE